MITTAEPLRRTRRASGMCDELVWEITDVLESFRSEESLKEIFWSILSYDQQRLPLSVQELHREVAGAISSLELFASHDNIGVVRAECPAPLTQSNIERICGRLESRFATLLLLVHEAERDTWTVVYPDRSRKHHLRFLAVPGPAPELRATAKALAALTAVDWASDDEVARFDVAQRMDVFFPGGMPKQRWEFDPAHENDKYSNSYMRRKAAPVAELYEDISHFPLLTEQQERGEDLAEDVGDGEEMNAYRWRLVLHNIRLVINIALTFPTNVLDLEDLVQEGILGLISAARKYDASRGSRFSTYAWYWIRQGIFRAIGNNQNLIRWPVHRLEELIPANRAEHAAPLSPGERYVKRLDPGDFESMTLIEFPEDDTLERDERIEALLTTIESLNERQQRILRLRFGLDDPEERTLEEVGQVEGVTRERIRQIQQKAIGELKHALPPWLRKEFERATETDQQEG
jgi:RNA polymerase sigma factor (sigma-70 family)